VNIQDAEYIYFFGIVIVSIYLLRFLSRYCER